MNGADRVFVDTNVLIYFFDAAEVAKHGRAQAWIARLWAEDSGCLSWQVIHEFYTTAIRKRLMPPAAVRSAAEDFCLWRPSEPSVAAMRRAWYWCDQAKLDYWDGLILATAEQAGCHYLLSEDFQPGKHYGTVTVVNPFEHEPAEFGFS